jgi:dTDP-4-amino-4,6-dideoxygalactose transaminase
MKIEFFRHNINERDIASAIEVLHSIFLTTGPTTARFEKAFAEYMGIAEAVGVSSCTGAMHLALLYHGIGPGDEVITTPMTFVATATAILQAGAKPIFADVCPKSGLLLPETAEAVVTKKTRAILPVHLYGRMVDMAGFAKLAKKYNLVLVEDSAHCIEGVRDGIRPGQLSNAACFSFYATKNMTCGEGGALICRSADEADWYRSARHHGISRNASSRYTRKYEHWDMEMMGWKYNMDDIQAALLVNQIGRLDENRRKRQRLENLYRKLLQDIDGLDFIEAPGKDERSGHHLFTVLLPRRCPRDEVLHRLQEQGVGCAVNYRAVHTLLYFQKAFGYKPEDYPVANDLGNRTISLPIYPGLSDREVEYVCATLREILESPKISNG